MTVPDTVREWAAAMRKTPEGSQVLANVREDENVPAPLVKTFFEKLALAYDASMGPMETMQDVLASISDAALGGPEAALGFELLTRFARLERLCRLPELKRAGVSLGKLVRMPRLTEKVKELPLGNRRGIVWAARQGPVDDDMRRGVAVGMVVDRLGISPTLEEPYYQVTYNTGSFDGPARVPTVLDAGRNHRFRPAGKGARHGMTKPCSGSGDGYPEYVHEKCTVERPRIDVHVA